MSYTNHNQGGTLLEGQPLQDNRRSWQGPVFFYSRGSRSSNLSRATAGPGATGRTYARHLRKKLSDLMKPAQPAAQPPPVVPGTSATPTAPPAASVPPVQLSIDQLYSKLKEAASAKPQGQEKTWNDEVTNAKECKKTGSTEAITKAVPQYRLAINRQRPAYGAIKAVARALRQCTPSQDSEERQVLHYMLAQLYRILGDRRQFSLHATLWLSKYGYTGKRLTPGQFNVHMNALEMVSDLDLYRIEKVAKLVKKRLTSKKGAKRLVQDEQTITGEQNKLKSALYWQASIDYDGMEKEQLDGTVRRGKLYELWDRAVRINALTYKNGLPKWMFLKDKSNKQMDGGGKAVQQTVPSDSDKNTNSAAIGDTLKSNLKKIAGGKPSASKSDANETAPNESTNQDPPVPPTELSRDVQGPEFTFSMNLDRTGLGFFLKPTNFSITVKSLLDCFAPAYFLQYHESLTRSRLAAKRDDTYSFWDESCTLRDIGVLPNSILWVSELPEGYKPKLVKVQPITNPTTKLSQASSAHSGNSTEATQSISEPNRAGQVVTTTQSTLALPNTGGGGQAPQGPRIWKKNQITILVDDFAGYACAATNYKRNTVVLTEPAIAFHWTRGQFCGSCHKRVEEGAFQPCAVCTRTVFCSVECRAMKSHSPAMCSAFKWRSVLSNRGHLIFQLVDYCGGVDKFARLWSKGEAFSKLNPGQMKAWPLIAVKLLFGREINKLFAAQKRAEIKAKQGQAQQYNLTTLVEAFQTVSILVATYPNVSEPDQLALLEMVYYLLRFMAVHCTGKIQTGGGGGGGSGGSTFRSKRSSTAGSTVSRVSSHSGKSRGSNFTGGSRSRSMMLKGSSKSYGGYALGAFSGLLRPSCDNNLRRRLNHKGMIEYVATREIENTEPLTLSFGANMAKYPKGVKRKQEIIKRFGFECACRDSRNTTIISVSSMAPAPKAATITSDTNSV